MFARYIVGELCHWILLDSLRASFFIFFAREERRFAMHIQCGRARRLLAIRSAKSALQWYNAAIIGTSALLIFSTEKSS